jgi:hypothetical protein
MALRSVVAALLVAGAGAALGQQVVHPESLACGVAKAKFSVKADADTATPAQAPAGKATVYVIESMPKVPFVTKNVDIGMDGGWLGATTAQTHMTFFVTPGVHHLCAEYQGEAAGMDDEGRVLLLRLDAEAGKTYYISYHGMFLKDSPSIAFFEYVDGDEGEYLVERTPLAVSTIQR